MTLLRLLLYLLSAALLVPASASSSSSSSSSSSVVLVETTDLSRGLAASLSEAVFGIQVDGIFHTSVHLHGSEYWFHFDGLHSRRSSFSSAAAALARGSTNLTEALARPPPKFHEVSDHGRTLRTPEELEAWFKSKAVRKSFGGDDYDIWSHNCNDFSSALLTFLGAAPLPSRVLDVPSRVLATQQGAALRPTITHAIDLMRKSSENGGGGQDASVVDEFLEQLANEPGPVGFIVRPIVKMMRRIGTW